MKIRTDFVTNSSSSNYILELHLIADDNESSHFSLEVSPETCWSDDGDMTADGISLIPRVWNGEIKFGTRALAEAKDIEALVDMLFCAAEIEGWRDGVLTDEEEEDDKSWYDKTVAVRDVAPKTIDRFLEDCKKKGIAPDKLKTIVIENAKFGHGDSAKWIECDDPLSAFENAYEQQGENRNPDKLQALIDYVKSEPALPANDNDYFLKGNIPCVWETSDEYLITEMKKLLEGKLSGEYWMCTFAHEYKLDVKNNTMLERDVLFYGSI